MRTLYVTDLDGTLLQSNERTSAFTNRTINSLVQKGMLFTYATARSYHTSHRCVEGLQLRHPIGTYNGAAISDPRDGSFLATNTFDDDIRTVLQDLTAHDIYPVVYAFVNGKETFTLLPSKSSKGLLDFDAPRCNDPRRRAAVEVSQLWEGDIYNVTCIDAAEKLLPFYEKYRERYHCLFQLDMYSGEPWLEFLPKNSTKANALRQLKQFLPYDKLVVFGDGINDMEMFLMADEAYAMENAVPELKASATAVIGGNNEDGVAEWLLANARIQGVNA